VHFDANQEFVEPDDASFNVLVTLAEVAFGLVDIADELLLLCLRICL
jgi:hypothetical protein